MVTPVRVKMLAQHGLWSRLLDEVLRNGRDVPLKLRLRLTEEGAEAEVAAGLALTRLAELARPGDRHVGAAIELLVGRQRSDGGFGKGTAGSVVGTGCALAGLLGVCEGAGFGAMPGWSTAWPAACGAGARLASLLEHADPEERTLVAWVLAPRAVVAARLGVDVGALLDGLDRSGASFDRVLGPMLNRVRAVLGVTPAAAA
ncbi:MAG: hypothetical protein KDA20_02305 [Phycisphaerales bacterium]|nr:hypothetical protein [Phycisphaerales bacterium]